MRNVTGKERNEFPKETSSQKVRAVTVPGIALSPDEDPSEATETVRALFRKAGIPLGGARLSVYKKSVDARVRGGVRTVKLVYTVLVSFDREVSFPEDLQRKLGAHPFGGTEEIHPCPGTTPMKERPLIVGMGPAGLFCALWLAEAGYRPVLIDRGDNVKDRISAKERFMKTGGLDVESNVQFGAGGAGTFSDGKLVTRINDPACYAVLKRFVSFGAPEEILTDARPHIGTDLLCGIVDAMLRQIEALGGKVLYRTRLDEVKIGRDFVTAGTTGGEIPCGALVLALGHSARDTHRMLFRMGLPVQPKPFSVGVRVEHLQSEIDRAMFGDYAGHPRLGHAAYNLSDTTGERGVYTFCMCPGGTVIAATSEEESVVVNGMSEHARDGKNAVAAVAVSVFPDDYGNTPEGGIAYQVGLEKAAFRMGGGAYAAPIQTLGDFQNGTLRSEPRRILPTYSRGVTRLGRLDTLFSSEITETLRRGFSSFGRKIPGYDAFDAVLTGVETRTSSPVRILRNEDRTAVGFPLIYPVGEGAGYAGGITSAAVDGIRTACALIERFSPPDGKAE